jgi:hypothetical protein
MRSSNPAIRQGILLQLNLLVIVHVHHLLLDVAHELLSDLRLDAFCSISMQGLVVVKLRFFAIPRPSLKHDCNELWRRFSCRGGKYRE